MVLDAAVQPAVLRLSQIAVPEEPLSFALLELLFDPDESTSPIPAAGNWHKDPVFGASRERYAKLHEWPDPRDTMTGVSLHIQLPLLPSAHVQLVPGSHRREWTAAEAAICLPNGADANFAPDGAMPGAVQPALEPGDALVFNSLCIHRGQYIAIPAGGAPRRTFMVSFNKVRPTMAALERGTFNGYPEPYFLDPGYLARAAPSTREYFHGPGYLGLYRAVLDSKHKM